MKLILGSDILPVTQKLNHTEEHLGIRTELRFYGLVFRDSAIGITLRKRVQV